jgi:hypothetical protein
VSPTPAGPTQTRAEQVDRAPAGPVDGPRPDRASLNGAPPIGGSVTSAPVAGSPVSGAPTPVASLNGASPSGPVPRPNGAPGQNGAERHQHAPAPAHVQTGGHAPGPGEQPNPERNGQCTAPQLRRFIKSRPYVPMHELRRRFGIDGDDDDVTPVKLDPGWVYVGLPNREGSLLGDLLRAGEIGYELSLDPRTPIVIGVYPMRPIPRS